MERKPRAKFWERKEGPRTIAAVDRAEEPRVWAALMVHLVYKLG